MKRNKSFDKNNNVLYMVAVPIGNLQEMTPRALEILKDSDYIFCEDTRNTASLLAKFNIHKELISLREHNESSTSNKAIELLQKGKKVSYVSDAGYPGISDPGYLLVQEIGCHICIPQV